MLCFVITRLPFLFRDQNRYVKRLWRDVRVGDVIHLSCNEVIPADMVVLNSSDEYGLCFIESSNLDGESNLKQRQSVKGLNLEVVSEEVDLGGHGAGKQVVGGRG